MVPTEADDGLVLRFGKSPEVRWKRDAGGRAQCLGSRRDFRDSASMGAQLGLQPHLLPFVNTSLPLI